MSLEFYLVEKELTLVLVTVNHVSYTRHMNNGEHTMTTQAYHHELTTLKPVHFKAIPGQQGYWDVVLVHKLYRSAPLNRRVNLGRIKATVWAGWLNLTRRPNITNNVPENN